MGAPPIRPLSIWQSVVQRDNRAEEGTESNGCSRAQDSNTATLHAVLFSPVDANIRSLVATAEVARRAT